MKNQCDKQDLFITSQNVRLWITPETKFALINNILLSFILAAQASFTNIHQSRWQIFKNSIFINYPRSSRLHPSFSSSGSSVLHVSRKNSIQDDTPKAAPSADNPRPPSHDVADVKTYEWAFKCSHNKTVPSAAITTSSSSSSSRNWVKAAARGSKQAVIFFFINLTRLALPPTDR